MPYLSNLPINAIDSGRDNQQP
ncbi:protein of unknown function [Pseudomonas mediterranea]